MGSFKNLAILDSQYSQSFKFTDSNGFERWEIEYDGYLSGQIPNFSFDPTANPTTLTWTPSSSLINTNQIFFTTCDVILIGVNKGGTKKDYVFHLRVIRDIILENLPSSVKMAFGVRRNINVIYLMTGY